MHVQRAGFRVIVVLQAVARNALSEGCPWSIVSRITSDRIYDASGADAGSMNRILMPHKQQLYLFGRVGTTTLVFWGIHYK